MEQKFFLRVRQGPSKIGQFLSKPAVLFSLLLSFLTVYNFVPEAGQEIQDFLTIKEWENPVPRIALKQGSFKGKILYSRGHPEPVEAFLGIPYAYLPPAERRFAKPVPFPQSNRTFDASGYSSRCPGKQLLTIPGTLSPEANENCLTLNIHRIRHTAWVRGKLPVLVHIDGGASDRDPASMLARSEELYLAISFNYRIGGLAAGGSLVNAGPHDQGLLLEWVRDNVAALGGDPDDVTISRLSAGAQEAGR